MRGRWRPKLSFSLKSALILVLGIAIGYAISVPLRRLADAPGYLDGGKTGTADKLKGRRYARGARIASFAGAFPMDRPRYVVFAMIDEPKGNESTHGYATGGWVAAPAVRRVVERMAPLLGIQPRQMDETESVERHLIPVNLKGPLLAAN